MLSFASLCWDTGCSSLRHVIHWSTGVKADSIIVKWISVPWIELNKASDGIVFSRKPWLCANEVRTEVSSDDNRVGHHHASWCYADVVNQRKTQESDVWATRLFASSQICNSKPSHARTKILGWHSGKYHEIWGSDVLNVDRRSAFFGIRFGRSNRKKKDYKRSMNQRVLEADSLTRNV